MTAAQPDKPRMTTLKLCMGKKRKSGIGYIGQKGPNLWKDRYSLMWIDGKKHSRNVYAKTREECEALLPGLIAEMKAEIQAIKQSGDLATIPDGVSKKEKLIAAYMKEHPEVTNKSLIAREVRVDKNTVRRYYDEIQKVFASYYLCIRYG